jgi:hypothetical protein
MWNLSLMFSQNKGMKRGGTRFRRVLYVCLSAAAAMLLPGCAGPGEEGVFGGGAGAAVGGGIIRSSSAQTAEARVAGRATGAAAATAIRIIAKYQATPKQREIAVRRAERVFRQMPAARKLELKKQKVPYLAVDTVRDERARGDKSVMIWDIEKEEIVGNVVYDVAPAPAEEEVFTFEAFRAEYVGDAI